MRQRAIEKEFRYKRIEGCQCQGILARWRFGARTKIKRRDDKQDETEERYFLKLNRDFVIWR